MGEKQWIAVDRLAELIEESLSACVGWTVPCPDIHLRTAPAAGEDWYVDSDGLEPAMVRAIESLQRRFRVEVPDGTPSTSGLLRAAIVWMRATRPVRMGFGKHP